MSTTVPVKDYEYFLSERGKRRKPSPIRALQPLMALPGMISLGGGLPNPSMFPFVKMEVGLKSGETVEISGKLLNDALQYSASVRQLNNLKLIQIIIYANPNSTFSRCREILVGFIFHVLNIFDV
jgi:hypothetical protein